MRISQVRRYESGQSEPTLDAIRKLAVSLSVCEDMLLFAHDKRARTTISELQFEAFSRLIPEEKNVICSMIESHRIAQHVQDGRAPLHRIRTH